MNMNMDRDTFSSRTPRRSRRNDSRSVNNRNASPAPAPAASKSSQIATNIARKSHDDDDGDDKRLLMTKAKHAAPAGTATATTTTTTTTRTTRSNHNNNHNSAVSAGSSFGTKRIQARTNPNSLDPTTAKATNRQRQQQPQQPVEPVLRRSKRRCISGATAAGAGGDGPRAPAAHKDGNTVDRHHQANLTAVLEHETMKISKRCDPFSEIHHHTYHVRSVQPISSTTTVTTATATTQSMDRRRTTNTNSNNINQTTINSKTSLARVREMQLLSNDCNNNSNSIHHVIGVDEAGRGPLAGPVVAAAICFGSVASSNPHVPRNNDEEWTIPGIIDSKKITNELDRERLYHDIIHHPAVQYAVAVVDVPTIDRINILQATLQAMSMAVTALLEPSFSDRFDSNDHAGQFKVYHRICRKVPTASTGASFSIDEREDENENNSVDLTPLEGCYVIRGGNEAAPNEPIDNRDNNNSNNRTNDRQHPAKKNKKRASSINDNDHDNERLDHANTTTNNHNNNLRSTSMVLPTMLSANHCYVLVDGNQLPTAFPRGVTAEYMIGGDSREYVIAAASIMAKVTRDRWMRAYASSHQQQQYGKNDVYGWAQNKGYGTAAHRAALQQYGPTPIHRTTFAPLKYMLQQQQKEQDEQGNKDQNVGVEIMSKKRGYLSRSSQASRKRTKM